LWDDISGSEALSGDIEYRKIFIGLGSGAGSDLLSNPVVWVISTAPGGDAIELLMTTAAADSVNVQSDITGATSWGIPTVKSDGVSIANMASSESIGVWMRRSVPASTPAYADDGATIRTEGDI